MSFCFQNISDLESTVAIIIKHKIIIPTAAVIVNPCNKLINYPHLKLWYYIVYKSAHICNITLTSRRKTIKIHVLCQFCEMLDL